MPTPLSLKAREVGRKLLLIDLSGDWCAGCRILAGVLETPMTESFIWRHYEVVTVDIGRLDEIQQIPARFGIQKHEEIPALPIVNTGTDKLVNDGQVSALADGRE